MSENPNYQQNPGEFIPAPQQAPAYNMQGGYPGYQPTPSSALAIASLILGVIGLLSGWLIFGGVLWYCHRCAGHDCCCCCADSGLDWHWHARRLR